MSLLATSLLALSWILPSFGVSGLVDRLDGGGTKSIDCSPVRCVLVGETGLLETREDDGTWTIRDLPTDQELFLVRWVDSEFVAFGDSGTLFRSTDGLSWSPTGRVPIRQTTFSAVIASPTWWVLQDGLAWRSRDRGTTWESDTIPCTSSFYAGIQTPWGPVLHDGSDVCQSTDGLPWSESWVGSGKKLARGVACSDSLCLQLLLPNSTGGDSSRIVSRRLGAPAWDTLAGPVGLDITAQLVGDGSRFRIVQDGSSLSSFDGRTWIEHPDSLLSETNFGAGTRHGNLLIHSSRYGRILVSDSTLGWRLERDRHPVESWGLVKTSRGVVRFGNQVFYPDDPTLSDGVAWSAVTDSTGRTLWTRYGWPFSSIVKGFAARGDTVVAGSQVGFVFRSVGGLSWDSVAHVFPLAGVAARRDGWMLAGSYDSVAFSPDGRTWASAVVPPMPGRVRYWTLATDSTWILGGRGLWESRNGSDWNVVDSVAHDFDWGALTSRGVVASLANRYPAMLRNPDGNWQRFSSFAGGSAVAAGADGVLHAFGPDSIVTEEPWNKNRVGRFGLARSVLEIDGTYWISARKGLLLRSRPSAHASVHPAPTTDRPQVAWIGLRFRAPARGTLALRDPSGRLLSRHELEAGAAVQLDRSSRVRLWEWRPAEGSICRGRLPPR
jgi:hypothetical protein